MGVKPDEELDEFDLPVANTRPALFIGIPWDVLVIMFITTAEIGMQKWWFMFFMIPVWAYIVYMVRHDYNAHRVALLWLNTSALDLSGYHWAGISTVDPFPTQPAQRLRGIPPSAW